MSAHAEDRVRKNTDEEVNCSIDRQTQDRVRRVAKAGPAAIEERLEELSHEWDIERALETMAPSMTLLGLTLGILRDRRWLALPLFVQAFFLQHAVQGWCPPMPVLRRLGFRTAAEIHEERNALKALRGDYQGVEAPQEDAVDFAVQAARV